MNVVATAPPGTAVPPATLAWLYTNVWRHARGVRVRYVVALAMLTASTVVKVTG